MANRKKSRLLWKFPALALLLLANINAVSAQTNPATGGAQSSQPPKIEYKDLIVTDARGKNGIDDKVYGFYDTIIVQVEKLKEWAQQPGNDPGKFILYLDGYPMKGMAPALDLSSEQGKDKLRYVLTPSTESAKEWKGVLVRPDAFDRTLKVSVGLENQPPIDSKFTIKLGVIKRFWFWAYWAALLVFVIIFIMKARTTALLRDAGTTLAGKDRPYSLGRCQMAFWFVLVIAAYFFIWMVTNSYEALPGAVLGLIGISAGTALGAVVIDSSKRDAAESELEKLQQEKASLEAIAAPLDAASQARLDQVKGRITEISKAIKPAPTESFFKDIMSDANGISFHRVQIAVWTLVLGVIFIWQVRNILTMPDFPESLLALMGISGGTYLGFKFPEKQG